MSYRRIGPGSPLTARQRVVLETIRAITAAHGYPPTVRELCAALRVTINAVNDHLRSMERKGAIARDRKQARNILVVGDERPAAPPPPERPRCHGGLFFTIEPGVDHAVVADGVAIDAHGRKIGTAA